MDRPSTTINDFAMNSQILVWMGIKFIDRSRADFWQNKYGEAYKKICEEYNLTPNKSDNIGVDGKHPVGVRPLLRKLVK